MSTKWVTYLAVVKLEGKEININMSITIDNLPNASALMQSLRDVGYELDTALAGLLDNSITASANNVDIIFETHPETKVVIIDDGDGMDRDDLAKAIN